MEHKNYTCDSCGTSLGDTYIDSYKFTLDGDTFTVSIIATKYPATHLPENPGVAAHFCDDCLSDIIHGA